MIKLQNAQIKRWLSSISTSHSADYRHQLLVENGSQRIGAVSALRTIVREAHQDTKEYLRQCTETDLDPLGYTSKPSIVDAYPEKLHLNTKKAYFGEVMAGLIAENFASVGPGNWRVLTFLFRLHELAFNQLELWRQTTEAPRHIPGQPGEDCVAFSIDASGVVKASLVCEGKCTSDHDSSKIADAHRTLSSKLTKPVSLGRIIKILKDQSNDNEAQRWVDILFHLYSREDVSYRRFDLVSYTCGRVPVRNSSWMPLDKPHGEYTGNRNLESVEIHLADVDALVEEVYRE